MRIESGLCIYAIMPCVAVAGGDCYRGVGAMVDNKGQRVGTRTAVGIGIVEYINACSSIGGAVPRVVVADGFGIAIVDACVDSQMESNNAITANGI